MQWLKNGYIQYCRYREVYPEPSETSKMKIFEKLVNDFQPLTIFDKCSISGVSQGSNTSLDTVR